MASTWVLAYLTVGMVMYMPVANSPREGVSDDLSAFFLMVLLWPVVIATVLALLMMRNR